jgi:hypothetical protein
MANGRIHSKTLKEDTEQAEIKRDTRLILLDLHLFADDEGYITLKKAKNEAELTDEAMQELEKAGFIKVCNKIIKILKWRKYQKISPSKFTESNLKTYWTEDVESIERNDAMPIGYQEYLETKKLRDAEKNLPKKAT